MMVWAEPFVELRLPKIFNLRRDPFERADQNSNTYWDWALDHVFALYPAQALADAPSVEGQVLLSLLWSIAILIVFVPLSVRVYRRTVG